MNRTILIVICDFLLVSLVAFSALEVTKFSDEGTERGFQRQTVAATNTAPPEAGKDLTAVMRIALDEERKRRDLLMGELDRARQAAAERERQVRAAQQELQNREQQTSQLAQQLQSRDQEASRLAQELQTRQDEARRLALNQSTLQGQYMEARTNINALTDRLTTSVAEAMVSKERLAALEAEIKKRAEEAAAMQEQMVALARSNQAVLEERQRIATQLQVAEVEKRHAVEQVAKVTQLVHVEREEKAKLAEGVMELASQSGELAKEVRENRPLAPNTIFTDFAANRVQAQFAAFKPGLIDTHRRRETETVIVSDGTNYMAICHIGDTPLTLTTPSTDWESLGGTLVRGSSQLPISSVFFHLQDPRLVMVPLTADEAKQLGSKVYQMSSDPAKFQDAVLVGTRAAYYGECRFQIDLSTPDYLRLDSSFLRGLFGKFNPSRGDLVFTRTGELLGIMANGSYCFVLQNLEGGAILEFGKDVRRQQPATLMSLLGSRVAGMPTKLQ
jgi:hypothetical protein